MPYEKRASEVKDYGFTWARHLLVAGEDVGDTISSSSWVVETGITRDSDSVSTPITTIWLSGGTEGAQYTVTNRVVTTQGRRFEQSFLITITSPPAT